MSTCTLLLLVTLSAPEIPGALPARPVALVGATIHPVSRAPIESAVIVFDRGKITAVGRDVDIPENAERIDVAGKQALV